MWSFCAHRQSQVFSGLKKEACFLFQAKEHLASNATRERRRRFRAADAEARAKFTPLGRRKVVIVWDIRMMSFWTGKGKLWLNRKDDMGADAPEWRL